MDQQHHHFTRLWHLYVNDQISDSQLRELIAFLQSDASEQWRDGMFSKGVLNSEMISSQDGHGMENMWQSLVALRPDLNADSQPGHPITSRGAIVTKAWFKWAAVLVLATGMLIFFWNSLLRTDMHTIVAGIDTPAPELSKAIIRLSDGRTIALDTAQTGVIAIDGDVIIEKDQRGNIVYKGLTADENRFNTLIVPRGSKITNLTLSDGTIVFLNSESTLKYPVAFAADRRQVEIEGEAYFEVTKNASKKFVVRARDMTVEVLGTKFNLNVYRDETNKRATLLEGGIKVNEGSKSIVLRPGEQAITQNGKLEVDANIDVSNVMAWKNGIFNFSNSHLDKVLRDIARWYDITVIYEGKVPQTELYGKIGRNLSLNQVLTILGDMNVKYKMKDEKTLMILSE